jgi:hypothetical protein
MSFACNTTQNSARERACFDRGNCTWDAALGHTRCFCTAKEHRAELFCATTRWGFFNGVDAGLYFVPQI